MFAGPSMPPPQPSSLFYERNVTPSTGSQEQQALLSCGWLSCNVCGKLLSSKRSLKQHMESVHDPLPREPLCCRYCRKSYKNKHTLNSHVSPPPQARVGSGPRVGRRSR